MRSYIALLVLASSAVAQTRYTIVDVQRVPALGDPASAIIQATAPAQIPEIQCDILVAGASAGGVAAALSAARHGRTVCLTEETDVIGGQFHSVPALDEHKFIEISGATRSYYELRERIRDHYRPSPMRNLNPGGCYVSSLCYEPEVAVAALNALLKPWEGKIRTLLRTKIVETTLKSPGVIESALTYNFETKQFSRIRPKYVLDATETGEILPLAKIPYAVGSEARAETAEPHAAPEPNPACVQSFTYTFASEYRPGTDNRIPKPPAYEKIRDSQPFTLRMNYPEEFGWKGTFTYNVFGEDAPVPNNMSPRPFFPWRRLVKGKPNDIALMNWPRQDYHTESLLDRTPTDTVRVLQAAKQVSLAFLYWMQNDIPRDGDARATGYPGFLLRKDVMGSADGLSKYPYIRESRRLMAQGRVTEQDLNIDHPTAVRARPFADSVGTGFYMVDIHPCGANEKGRMMMPKPFQVPMSAMLPKQPGNVIAAAKNIGVTHLTNGAFRLHPIEWNVGEVAAVIAHLAIGGGAIPSPTQVQREIVKDGIPLVWFDDVSVTHPAFAAIHLAAINGWFPVDDHNLHASADAPVTRHEAARILATWAHPGQPVPSIADAVKQAVAEGWMAVDHRNWFHGDLPLYWTDIRADKLPRPLPAATLTKTGPVTRAELAVRLTDLQR